MMKWCEHEGHAQSVRGQCRSKGERLATDPKIMDQINALKGVEQRG